ncbi:bifunctional DedA family/phosphatase PAP2 family protein [Paenibacillus sp. HJGM_3]|uniref:bifunctional DedA family/phosphatase PAP2 family protein n=1 Tax=Paenibacillus sp. HJGM_3 TaxID=3379816 RepID=UPI003859ECC0
MLFIGLFLEMLALPLPGELLMSYAGLLVFEGKLNTLLAIGSAGTGVMAGITVSYWIGYRLGKPVIIKYGSRFHMGEEKFERIDRWFEQYGDKLVVVAYFIPGVRHITGYFCGITRMPFKKYVLYAYSGAVIWTGLFISLGKLLGPKWEEYHRTVNRYLILFAIASAVISLLVLVIRRSRQSILDTANRLLVQGIQYFNSFGKVRFLVLAAYTIFVLFVSLMLGLIQDFWAREFTSFDTVASYLVHAGFNSRWEEWMYLFQQLGTYTFYVPLIVLTGIGIMIRSKDKVLELLFLVWVVVGGEVLDESLRALFHRAGPSAAGAPTFYTFPSEETLSSITVSGFAAFLLVRHYRNVRLHVAAILVTIALCLLVGISRVYFNVQYPSDVIAGYVFGMVWLSLNVIVLEILRKLQRPTPIMV